MVKISYQLDFGDYYQSKKTFFVLTHKMAAQELKKLRKWYKGLRLLKVCLIWVQRDGEKEKIFTCVP